MDCDIQHRRTRYGRLATQLVLLPDPDRSDPENDSDSEMSAANQSSDDDYDVGDEDDVPLTQYVQRRAQDDATVSSDDDIPLSNWRSKNCSKPSISGKQKNPQLFKWVKGAQQRSNRLRGCDLQSGK